MENNTMNSSVQVNLKAKSVTLVFPPYKFLLCYE